VPKGYVWPREVRRAFWDEVRAGRWVHQAAVAVGVSAYVGQRWFTEAGGVMEPRVVSRGRCLSLAEREEIAVLAAQQWGVRQIGVRLGRAPSTVSRELRRNRSGGGRYRAVWAQQLAERRARRPKPAKLAGQSRLRAFVQARLLEQWSPAQISAVLARQFGHDERMQVSPETIYQSLYVQGRGALRQALRACLRPGRAVRRPQRRPHRRQGRLTDMVLISQRPPEVADRAVPGHWEGDLILGKNGASAIGTLVERASRFVLLLHLPGRRTAEEVRDQMIPAITTLPQALRRSLTWDQGKEMALHAQIAAATDMTIYFCDPHSPWQRGSNENTNGLLRQYFPKNTSLRQFSPDDLDEVARRLNTRPRKTLDWKTPAQALEELLSNPTKQPSVAPTG
jgi:IS30 family transposase